MDILRALIQKSARKFLEVNEKRIFVYVTDEVGFNIWGNHFRPLMSSIPGSIRVFTASNAPMLCLSATVGKQEEKKIMEDLGMINRSSEVIASSPVLEHLFLGKLRRPSNQRGFYEQGGLKEILDTLYLDEFFNDPVNCRRTIFFCKSEDDIVQIYEYVEQKIGQNFPTMKKRPWVQYHSSTGEKTLKWIHLRMRGSEDPINLIISTYKLLMGVDCQNLDLAIFLRYVSVIDSNLCYDYCELLGHQTVYHALSRGLVEWAGLFHLVPEGLLLWFFSMKRT